MGRPTKEQQEAKKLRESAKPFDMPEQQSEHISTNITEADFFELQERCQKLEAVISRLAVNTGNGNWLREFGIERWQPGKEHMGKKYA